MQRLLLLLQRLLDLTRGAIAFDDVHFRALLPAFRAPLFPVYPRTLDGAGRETARLWRDSHGV